MTDSEAKQILEPVMDLFTGADGGVGYLKLRTFLAETGDVEAVAGFVGKFSKLCEIMLRPDKYGTP
jgi:hypothetical protein